MSSDGLFYFHRDYMPAMYAPSIVPHMYDRTQKMIPRPEIKRITPIGDPNGPQFTLDELMVNRAKEIIATLDNRKLAVCWSGGIDSTSVLLAFMDQMDHKDITVLMNDKSILEYEDFYKNRIDGQMPVIQLPEYAIEATMNSCVLDGYTIVTGEIGDQMFGSIKYDDYKSDYSELMKPWQTLLEGVSGPSQNAYNTLVSACPVEMTTVKMFWWWFNYVLKYQGVQLRMMLEAPDARLNDNVFHFFDSAAWNDWCLYTDQEIRFPGIDPLMYKKPLKDYILEKTGDQTYYDTKGKVRSLIIYRGKLKQLHEVTSIDTDWIRT